VERARPEVRAAGRRVEVPLERNRSVARPASAPQAARIGHLQFFDRAA
jgi:hypothetical protein